MHPFRPLEEKEEETQFSRRAFFSIFNTQRREIVGNTSLVPSCIAYWGLHARKRARQRECCTSPGKIIVKTLVEERRGQPKGRINLDVSESSGEKQRGHNAGERGEKGGMRGEGMCCSYTAPPFYFMLRFARKITAALAIPFENAF